MPDKFYAEIFKHSGASYHQAMQLYPSARDEEFNAAVSLLKLNDGDRVLDVPAGGGYLKSYLNNNICYHGLDFSAGFNSNAKIAACTETKLKIEDSSIDKALCLASMHHVENKTAFLNELHRCLRPQGALLIGDVIAGGKEAAFLNGFVNQWNSLGHDGDFIDQKADLEMLHDSGFAARYVIKRYRWNFVSQAACRHYRTLLFSLDKQPPMSVIDDAINKLGMVSLSTCFQLHWSLGFFIASKFRRN